MTLKNFFFFIAANSSKPAQLTLLIKSGASFSGKLASYDEDKSVCTLVQNDQTTTLINTYDISSVTIIDAGSAKIALQGNKIYRESTDAVQTNLMFKRYLADLTSKKPVTIQTSFAASDLESDDCRFYSEKVLKALEESLVQVLADQAGKDAIAAKGNTIKIIQQAAADLVVSKAGNSVSLQFDCTAPLVADYKETITTELNSVL